MFGTTPVAQPFGATAQAQPSGTSYTPTHTTHTPHTPHTHTISTPCTADNARQTFLYTRTTHTHHPKQPPTTHKAQHLLSATSFGAFGTPQTQAAPSLFGTTTPRYTHTRTYNRTHSSHQTAHNSFCFAPLIALALLLVVVCLVSLQRNQDNRHLLSLEHNLHSHDRQQQGMFMLMISNT